MKKMLELFMIVLCVTVLFKNGVTKTYEKGRYFTDNSECGLLGGCSQATTYKIFGDVLLAPPIAVININEVLSISQECE
ncbi:MAG: hypothetical protein M0R03_08795 [Novosphingobium sp.]|nr:hypothetical protein [Novosphingobium sp.]